MANPTHALLPSIPDAPTLRTLLIASATSRIEGCFAAATDAGIAQLLIESSSAAGGSASSVISKVRDPQSTPLVCCARHKTLAVQHELESIPGSEEAAVLQLDANRDALVAATLAVHAARVAEVRSASASKRVSLEAQLVTSDAALEGACSATEALLEVSITHREYSTMCLGY